MALNAAAAGKELSTTGLDLHMEMSSGANLSSAEQGKIGGGNVVQIFENTHKYIGQVRSGEEKAKLLEEREKSYNDLHRSPLGQRRHALEDAGRTAELDKLVQAINSRVLRDDFPTLSNDFKIADEYVFKIQRIDESLKGLEIKPEVEAIAEEWDGYLYDRSGNPIDQAKQLSTAKTELGKAVGLSAIGIKEEQLRLLKEGAQTPEILKLYFQTETVLESQLGETFASYLKFKEATRKAGERGGKPLTTKETKDWNEIKGVVETQFAGKENLLAILTGDFEKDDALSKSEKRVLGAVRNMVSTMAKADGKGLGKSGFQIGEIAYSDYSREGIQQQAEQVLMPVKLPEVTEAAWNTYEAEQREKLAGKGTQAQIDKTIADKKETLKIV